MMTTWLNFQANPFYLLGDMDKTTMLQVVVLNYYRSFLQYCRKFWKSTRKAVRWKNYDASQFWDRKKGHWLYHILANSHHDHVTLWTHLPLIPIPIYPPTEKGYKHSKKRAATTTYLDVTTGSRPNLQDHDWKRRSINIGTMKLLRSSATTEEAITCTSIRRQSINKKEKAIKKMYMRHEKHTNIKLAIVCMSPKQPSSRYRYAIFLTSSLEHIIVRNLLSMHQVL